MYALARNFRVSNVCPLFLAVVVVCWSQPAAAAPFAYIANSADDTVSVIETEKNAVEATVVVGDFPVAVAVHPDGSQVYAINGQGDSISVIDAGSNSVVATVPLSSRPAGVAVHPLGTFVYISHFGGSLSVFDTETLSLVAEVDLSGSDAFLGNVAVHPYGTFVYVAHSGFFPIPASVDVVDTATNTQVASVVISMEFPRTVAVSLGGSKLYVGGFELIPGPIPDSWGRMSIIDTSTNTEIGVWDGQTEGSKLLQGIAVLPDRRTLYVSDSNGTVWELSRSGSDILDSITVGGNPIGVAALPDGSAVYVVNEANNNVAVIDPNTNTVAKTVSVGTEPISHGQFIVPRIPCELTLHLSHESGLLGLNFLVGAIAEADWSVWISFQTITAPLWSVGLPEVLPPTVFPVSFPLEGFETVGVLTTLATRDHGIICSAWETVDTGSPTAGRLPMAIEDMQGLSGRIPLP